jgi:hypothetical protein
MPVFSNLRLRSKIFFSSSTFSIVRSPGFIDPASGGRPASARYAARVWSGQWLIRLIEMWERSLLHTYWLEGIGLQALQGSLSRACCYCRRCRVLRCGYRQFFWIRHCLSIRTRVYDDAIDRLVASEMYHESTVITMENVIKFIMDSRVPYVHLVVSVRGF